MLLLDARASVGPVTYTSRPLWNCGLSMRTLSAGQCRRIQLIVVDGAGEVGLIDLSPAMSRMHVAMLSSPDPRHAWALGPATTIVDPESVPKNVQRERPNAKSKKGNWYCVRFFPAGDYAWMVPKDISKLQQHEIQAYINEPYKRSGDLLQGYKIALDPTKWEEERDAAQAEAAEEEANAEVDQLESDAAEEEEEEEEKPKTKKRKRDSEVASAKAKPKSKSKKDSVEPKKKSTTASKGKKNGVKSKTLVESEDEGAAEGEEEEDAGPSKKASPPPAKKQKRDKDEEEADSALNNDPEATKVRDWRHKLQKAFLGKLVPKEEDVPGLDALFSTVESYDNMTIQYLTVSTLPLLTVCWQPAVGRSGVCSA
ncbi:hypothetical protein NM688_g8106 [Phlebia brevispora]|uniref:Uncharacterized protein n=1 Tax=Phlebia brevispora TaxID=194682 RepID=A0ACC1RX91_9APHY|nr:hypothetical protein NM688_g8106 [Phlebia brevispora]